MGVLTFIRPQNDSVTVFHDRHRAQLYVGQFDSPGVDFNLHVLHQRHFHAVQPHGDRPQPAEGHRVAGIVGDANRKGGIFSSGSVVVAVDAVLGQKVLAAPLKVENAAVESPVVRVTEYCADRVFLLAFRTTGSFRQKGLLAVTALEIGAVLQGAFRFAVGTGTTLAAILPRMAILVNAASVITVRRPHRCGLRRAGRATVLAASEDLSPFVAFQWRTGSFGALHGQVVITGAVGAGIRLKVVAFNVDFALEDALVVAHRAGGTVLLSADRATLTLNVLDEFLFTRQNRAGLSGAC